MDQETIRIHMHGLTELDRLELEKSLGAENLEVKEQRTPEGHLGEPGSMTVILTVGLAALQVAGGALAIWLAKGRRKSVLEDEIEIETRKGKIRRKIHISSDSSDAIKADVVKQISDMVALAGAGSGDSEKK